MEAKARRMVMDPTRPKIISKVNTISERELSSGVIPKERPTVAIAEAVSNKVVRMGRDSTELMSRAEKMVSPRYSINTQEAVRRVSSSTRRPKHSMDFFLRKVAPMLKRRTASVVVFIPPAVEPVDPPTSIRQIIKSRLVSRRDGRSTVLKPAVLGLTD